MMNKTTLNRLALHATLAVALAVGVSSARPAQAQDGHHYTRTQTTIVRRYTYAAPLSSGRREAQRLHREAVRLDHQATYEDQHGHPRLGARLARQASQLNAEAYRAAHR